MVANSTGRFGRRISPGRTPKTARLFQRHVLHRPPIHVRPPGEDMRPGGCSRLVQCRRGHVETPEGAFQHLVDIAAGRYGLADKATKRLVGHANDEISGDIPRMRSVEQPPEPPPPWR